MQPMMAHEESLKMCSSLRFHIHSIRYQLSARDNITVNQPLLDNQTLISSDGRFALGFFTPPGNLSYRYLGLWYNNISDKAILWVANRANPIINSKGTLSISTNGVLSIKDQNSTAVWNLDAYTSGMKTAPTVQLLNTGNLVVVADYKANPSLYLWESFNYPTDTLLPGMKLGVRFNWYSWIIQSWAGKETLQMKTSDYSEMQLIDTNLGVLWRTGPWDWTFAWDQYFNFTNTPNEISYLYMGDTDSPSRLVVNESGFVQLLLWKNNHWNIIWHEPKNLCDKFGYCGPNTVCDSRSLPVCSCLPGFASKGKGCAQTNNLKCDGTDGFAVVNGTKLPEPSNVIVHKDLSFTECQSLCQGNCSCTAFSVLDDDNAKCVIWSASLSDITLYNHTGHNLYVRVSNENKGNLPIENKDSPNQNRNINRLVAIIVGVIFGVLLLSCVGCIMCRRKKKETEIDGENDLELPLVDFEIITTATNNFSAENKLGEGGFGPVYKGKLEEDQEIAVKRLSKSSQQGVDEFKNEVQLIAKLQHRNLVRLLGCCIKKEERMLIYEYMPNKSLDVFLFGKEGGALLDWNTRYSIIIGVAQGVLYLHRDSRLRIIHRDLKASNILLDKDMNPKISDFGMARICGGNETDFNTRKIVGTYGYMSPEYALEGIFSMKSDIFSFGVLVLEIVSGKKNRGVYAFSTHLNLLAHVWDLWRENNCLQVVDEHILSSNSSEEVVKCIKIGLLCVQERPEERPLMPYVIEMFSRDITLLPEPNPPGFVSRFAPPDVINIQELFSLNNVSITSLGGR